MDIKTKKIVGWVLVFLSLILILLIMFQTFKIFTGIAQPPEIFSKEVSVAQPQNATGKNTNTEIAIQEQLQKTISDQIQGIIPAGSASKMLNLSSWLVFVFVVIFGASKIGSLGVSLLKE